MQLNHGCRAQHGPLILRVEATTRINGFLLYVEDPRQEHATVYEHAELDTLDSAKETAVMRADEYLHGIREPLPNAPHWRCS